MWAPVFLHVLVATGPVELPPGQCVETTSSTTTFPGKVKRIACAMLGQAKGCGMVEVERFRASGFARVLWLLSYDEVRAEQPPALPPTPRGPVRIEPGQVNGEDALVPSPPLLVPCGALRPRWVDEAPRRWWEDAVLIATRAERKKARSKEGEPSQGPTGPSEKERKKTKFRWARRAKSRLEYRRRRPAKSRLEASQKRQLQEPVAVEGAQKARNERKKLATRSRLMDELLAQRGLELPSTRPVASYRFAGQERYVLYQTDYTQSFLQLPEPARSKAWAKIHEPRALTKNAAASVDE